MANYNRVLLMGNLTRDPELRYTPQGTPVADFGIAINRDMGTAAGAEGERRKEVTFVDITAWAKKAEVICEYFHKGDPIFIEGRLTYEAWDTAEGQRRSKLKVTLESFEFLGGRAKGGEGRSGAGAPVADYQYPGTQYAAGSGLSPEGGGSASGPRAGSAPPRTGVGRPQQTWGEGGGPSEIETIDDSEIPF
jgi:single-strand DNA-binding protein